MNLILAVRSREKTLFEGEVKAVTSYNDKGIFDILPYHTNFITLIKKSLIIHKIEGNSEELKVDSGVLKVSQNQVHVYLGILT